MQAQACRASWCPHFPHANTHTHSKTHSSWHRHRDVGCIIFWMHRIGIVQINSYVHLWAYRKPSESSAAGKWPGPQDASTTVRWVFQNPFSHVSNPPSLLRSCAAERFLAGSTGWPTSVPVCHSSRAACPKSGSRRPPYSPASARSCTEPGSWRRRRTPPPRPPWRPCLRAPPQPPPALPLCPVTLATSPEGRRCGLGWQTLTDRGLPVWLHSPCLAVTAMPSRGNVWVCFFFGGGGKEVLVLKASFQWSSYWSKPPFSSQKQREMFHEFVVWIYQLFVPVCRWC